MYAEERRREIARRIGVDGRVDVAELAATFGVTTETVRRDLSALEQRGVLRRVHGGAVSPEPLPFEPTLDDRVEAMAAEKERIAKAAVAEVPESGSVFLDAGSTTEQLAKLLPEADDLVVLTHSLPIGAHLALRGRGPLYVIGGRVRRRTLASVGADTTEAVARLTVDVAFVGTNGLSAARGLTTPDADEAAVKRAIVGAARRVVVLTDHTKYGLDSLVRFGELTDVEVIVTDSGLPPDAAADLEAAGPRVVRA